MAAKILFAFCLLLLVCIAESQPDVTKFFNVKNYGAIADGKTDNSAAFLKAWSDACNSNGKVTLKIPQGTYMLKQVTFNGPCKGWTIVRIEGVLLAPSDPFFATDQWINFRYVNNLIVSGPGSLDGQGSSAWRVNKNHNRPNLPISMTFYFVTNGFVHHLSSINSKGGHFKMFACENMTFMKVKISAPGDSPNTDGIKVANSSGVSIRSSNIGTGDDCIAMISGSKNVLISDVFCGPGHGISVGSLGRNDGEEDVENINVRNCTLSGTTNGLRIKTWALPLSKPLKASNFMYEDIMMNNVDNPIIIDQEYCPSRSCSNKDPSKVEISNVSFKNIHGSSNTQVAISLKCSAKYPCKSITMDNIDLWQNRGVGKLSNLCSNVKGASYGKQNPPSCL
ncbi:Pectin lyase superfamily protein [Trifolium repens]|nr:Pectin lyase superfamily protein [Trifolium repens]